MPSRGIQRTCVHAEARRAEGICGNVFRLRRAVTQYLKHYHDEAAIQAKRIRCSSLPWISAATLLTPHHASRQLLGGATGATFFRKSSAESDPLDRGEL